MCNNILIRHPPHWATEAFGVKGSSVALRPDRRREQYSGAYERVHDDQLRGHDSCLHSWIRSPLLGNRTQYWNRKVPDIP